MFGKKPKSGPIESLIGASSRVEGGVSFSGGLRVDGQVIGNITASNDKPSTLILSESAYVEGEIRVGYVVVNGTVDGPIHAAEFLELSDKARVTGDVYYKSVEVHVGAVISGKMVHENPKAEKVVELKPASGN